MGKVNKVKKTHTKKKNSVLCQNMASTKWGIVSSGKICHDFVNAIQALENNADHQIVAVAARKIASAKGFAAKFNIAKAYEGYEPLAHDPEVEVVYVGAINTTHLNIVKLLLNNGKHILCEKPLGMNVKETKEMLELAKEKNLFLMEAIWSRFQPSYLKLKEEIDKGLIGEVSHVQAEFGFNIEADRLNKKELGGGACLDIGIYCIQLAQFVFNGEKPNKVLACGHMNEDGVDEFGSGTFLYSAGRSATFQYTSRVDTNNEAHIYGTKGKMTLKFPFWCTTKLQLQNGEVVEFSLPKAKYDYNFLNSGGLGIEAQHVRECLLKGLKESPALPHIETLTIAELMESIRKQIGVAYPQDD